MFSERFKEVQCFHCSEYFEGFTKFVEHLIRCIDESPERFNHTFREYGWRRVIDPLIAEHGTLWMLEDDVTNALVKLADVDQPEHPWEEKYELKAGDIFVEVGAFHGRYARKVIKDLNGTVAIILIEPSQINSKVIETWVNQQNLMNIILVDCALGKEENIWKFVEAPTLSASRLGGYQYELEERHIKCSVDVLVDTLDNIMKKLGIDHIDLLAADIEGAEIPMLEGAKGLLSDKRIFNVALAGYHGASSSEAIIEHLQGYDYKGLVYEKSVVYGHAH